MAAAQPALPRRGGSHPLLGIYLGGTALDEDFKAVPGSDYYYNSTTQLRSVKHLPALEATLQKMKDNPTTRQFNGQLEAVSTTSTTELDKAELLRAVDDMVYRYGLETFFYMKHPTQNRVINLAVEPHAVTLDDVRDMHNSRLVEPPPVYEADGVTETQASTAARFRCYDDYEKCDFGLSRMAVEALVSPALRATIYTRYNDLDDFKRFPGQLYLMLVLDVANASVSLDISGARQAIADRTLDTYPGEDVSAFLVDYRRDLKVMKTGYALPYDCGSTLLRKLRTTQHELFNLAVTSLLEKASEMEDSHGESKDPLLLEQHADYVEFGPFGLIDKVENLFGKYKKKRDWPAASDTIPHGNNASTETRESSPPRSVTASDIPVLTVCPPVNPNNRHCNICGCKFHFSASCPFRNVASASGGESTTGTSTPSGGATPSDAGNRAPNMIPLNSIRYIQPADPNQSFTANGTTYYFCSKCKCRVTGTLGFYNRTHTTANHREASSSRSGRRSGGAAASPSANNASIPSGERRRSVTFADAVRGQEAAPTEDNIPPAAPESSPDSDDSAPVDPDPDGLEYVGAYLASAEADYAWMAAVNEDTFSNVVSHPTLVHPENSGWDDDEDDPNEPEGDKTVEQPLYKCTWCGEQDNSFGSTCTGCAHGYHVIPSSMFIIPRGNYGGHALTRNFVLCGGPGGAVISLGDGTAMITDSTGPTAKLATVSTSSQEDYDFADDFSSDLEDDEAEPRMTSTFTVGLEYVHVTMPLVEFNRLFARSSSGNAIHPNTTNAQSTHYLPSYAEFFDATYDYPSFHTECEDATSGSEDNLSYFDCLEPPADVVTSRLDPPALLPSTNHLPLSHDIFRHETSSVVANDAPSFSSVSSQCSYSLAFISLQALFYLITTSFSSIYQAVSTLLLFIFTVFWDSVIYLHDQTDVPPARAHSHKVRRILQRQRHSSSLRFYPRVWMLLGCLMLGFGATSSHFIHPCVRTAIALQSTYSRCGKLATMVDLSPFVLYQYNCQRFHELNDLRDALPLCCSCIPPASNAVLPPVKPHTPLSSQSDVSSPGDHFFLSYNSQSELEGDITKLDFFLAEEPHIYSPSPLDWLKLDQICTEVSHVHLPNSTKQDDDALLPSPVAYNAGLLLGQVDLLHDSSSGKFPVIFDSGATLAISPDKNDFAGAIRPLYNRRLGGMANGLIIEGIGRIEWGFKTPTNQILIIHSECYYVPDAKVRLLSPQRLFNSSEGVSGSFTVGEHNAVLTYDNVGKLEIEYDSSTHLPIKVGKNLSHCSAVANLSILNEDNQNLSPSQQLLLHWHYRFGHRGFAAVQRLFRLPPFGSDKFISAGKCVSPVCEVCQYAKGARKSTKGSIHVKNSSTEGAIKVNDLRAGATISVDHFESRLKGRTLTSLGRTSSDHYVGGCVFVDHMSGFLHVEPQLGFSASETIRAKQNFEKFALDYGVIIENYVADNGTFKANSFVQHIRDHNQRIRYCGVNAHHKNGVAERSIRTVSEIARSMMLHSALRWKDGIDSTYWPLAVQYAAYIYNHLPNNQGIAPADLFTGVEVPRHKLRNLHTWGCPVYVLDPKLQQGQKLPKWQPRSRQGIFMGFSPSHSSDVPLVLNRTTGHISPQFHVVFDDDFSSVASLSASSEPPTFWNDIGLDDIAYDAHVHRVPLDPSSTLELSDEWLTPPELEEKRVREQRSARIRDTFAIQHRQRPPSQSSSSPTSRHSTSSPSSPPGSQPQSSSPSSSPSLTMIDGATSSSATGGGTVESSPPSDLPCPPQPPPLRRSSRANKGTFTSTRYIDQTFLTSVTDVRQSVYERNLAYLAEQETDFDSGELNVTDARAYAAKMKHDPDMPSFHEAVTGEHSHEYEKAMETEIRQLIKQNTWKPILRSDVPAGPNGSKRKILRGTWAFKLKRLPDGSPLKFKARYCVRGDLQTEGVDFFETYAPVVNWSTVRLLLTMVLANGWTTKQVDYTNAFAQAHLDEEVYIEPPRGFSRRDGKDMVLRLIKSLYGLRQAPKAFFDKLKEGLLERGFVQSSVDPCLFLKKDMICVVYVDDTIIAGPNGDDIEALITSLGVAKEEQRHTFELRDEGEVGDFLGIRIEKTGDNSFSLSQTGLINKVLETAKMSTCNSVKTPSTLEPLHTDAEGDDYTHDPWDYAVVIGMLMFLSTNSRPDIAYAVHQCARFSHKPKKSHAEGVKRILRYLQGTKDKGMILRPSSELRVDCYVDADFAGQWKTEDPQLPVSVKSRTGYLITFMGCPLQWMSKLQTQIALSTMEAEYIALSQSMRELIALREVLKEVYAIVLTSSAQKQKGGTAPTYHTVSKTFGKIPQSLVHEDNEACLKFATVPKMSPRTKHIAIPYHFFRTKVKELEIKIVGINTDNQLADQFTKGLPQAKFEHDRKQLMGW